MALRVKVKEELTLVIKRIIDVEMHDGDSEGFFWG